MRSPLLNKTAKRARFLTPVGAHREQAARSASTSARVRGSAGNRRAGFRFTQHQTVLEHVQCRFSSVPTLYGPFVPAQPSAQERNDTLWPSGDGRLATG